LAKKKKNGHDFDTCQIGNENMDENEKGIEASTTPVETTTPTSNAGGIKATARAAPTISQILNGARGLCTAKNVANWVHWMAIGSAVVVSVGTAIVGGNEKLVGYGTAVGLVSVAQIIHKLMDALDHQQTLAQAVEATLPAIEAATTGNHVQLKALEQEIHK
jgi:hypothetical protein